MPLSETFIDCLERKKILQYLFYNIVQKVFEKFVTCNQENRLQVIYSIMLSILFQSIQHCTDVEINLFLIGLQPGNGPGPHRSRDDPNICRGVRQRGQ